MRCLNVFKKGRFTSMLWFKFIPGLMFFELVSILFAIVPDYGNGTRQRKIKNELVLKFLNQKEI